MKLIFNEQVESGINIVLYDCSKDCHISTEILKKHGSGPTINRSDWKFIYGEIISDYLLIPVDKIRRSIHNKPYLEGRREKISISHTGDLLAVIISESKRVGVDIEILGDSIEQIAKENLGLLKKKLLCLFISRIPRFWIFSKKKHFLIMQK